LPEKEERMAVNACFDFEMFIQGDGTLTTFEFNILEAPFWQNYGAAVAVGLYGGHLPLPSSIYAMNTSGTYPVTGWTMDTLGNVNVTFSGPVSPGGQQLSGRFLF
jgi:hypothetical protein